MSTQVRNYYNHSEYVQCMNMDQFAQVFAFRDKTGKVLGKNLVYAIMRKMGILKQDNEPYQEYINAGYLKCQYKQYYMGDRVIPKNIALITQEGIKYFPGKIQEFIEQKTHGRLTLKKIKELRV